MNPNSIPLLEFDSESKALIEPSEVYKRLPAPEICIYPFYYQLVQKLASKGILKEIAHDDSVASDPIRLYSYFHQNKTIAIMTPGLGAPFAAACLEFAIACGCKKFLVIGSCGVLDSSISRDQLIIPTSAIRDEGTSFSYIAPDREISQDANSLAKMLSILDREHIKYFQGKTWTTDALFRETAEKIKRRKAEGAIAVEMEASALMAVAQFRKVNLAYILAAGDDVGGLTWDSRNFFEVDEIGAKQFWLAVNLAFNIYE